MSTEAASGLPKRDKNFLASVFQSVDKDRTGRISSAELQRALSNGNWKPFNESLVNLMIKMFDREFTGNIKFEEFCNLWNFITEWINGFRKYVKLS